MFWTWTKYVGVLFAVALLAGCATDKEKLLPHNGSTMLDIWDYETAGSATGSQATRRLLDARQQLRRPLLEQGSVIDGRTYTRTAQNEINRQFHRLPNPDLVMYVFPHLAGTDPVPVPGYSTVFPLYQRVQYALPGERTEDY
ncbi:TIGR03751 family conjugal transfer lipoprotein [Paraburkholderia sp. Ac-20342]|uniref:TIGR03751 family conjugal transfer lipoprotein n=1 Tax=Paraburkholderia sp. Ac-20342 TaxID=2703889 RepID=UPI00198025F4|nr:TIGR03751 family conjugal transfer lipoprotein [Paraburkholderia sp. Ac-20342]MBN3848531.1 TIGR03751 family conjugal transfer lipoprotein [Paraburkholderia sp. Ac-20342]